MSDAIYFKRPSWHQVFIEILESFAKRSQCIKIQTAALIVHNTHIMAIGYNGTFRKHKECNVFWREKYEQLYSQAKTLQSHDPIVISSNSTLLNFPSFNQWILTEEFRLAHRKWSLENEVHAEANALQRIDERNITDDYIMYTLYSPCDLCAKSIISYGIKTVYYKYLYPRGINAIKKLKNAGIICELIV